MLKGIAVFVRAVRLGSIAAAGRELGLSPAAASHRIRQLESLVGARLLDRQARGLGPTEAGRVFLDHATVIVAEIEAAMRNVNRAATPSAVAPAPPRRRGWAAGGDPPWRRRVSRRRRTDA